MKKEIKERAGRLPEPLGECLMTNPSTLQMTCGGSIMQVVAINDEEEVGTSRLLSQLS